ncbi:hypothetical protein ACOMHN_005058 [Nucella lapillus]
MRLLETCRFLNLGHHLGLDNFFTSPALFRDLYVQQERAAQGLHQDQAAEPGGVRATQRGAALRVLPRSLTESYFAVHCCLCWIHEHSQCQGPAQKTPKDCCQVQQIHGGGGVDLCDSKLYCYCGERGTIKWTNKVAFGLFGRALLNAYILYDLHSSDIHKLTRKMFLVDVLETLAGGYYPPKVVRRRRTQAQIEADRAQPQVFAVPQPADPQPGPAGDAGHQLRKLPGSKRRNCVAGHDGRKRSRFECPACDIGLCPECFAQYHKKPRV